MAAVKVASAWKDYGGTSNPHNGIKNPKDKGFSSKSTFPLEVSKRKKHLEEAHILSLTKLYFITMWIHVMVPYCFLLEILNLSMLILLCLEGSTCIPEREYHKGLSFSTNHHWFDPYLKEITKKPPIRHTDKESMKLAIIRRLIWICDNKLW